MKAVCVVAHPDDCLIYGRQYILHHKEYEWSIVYLTYQEQDARAIEIAAYWNKLGITTRFLGYKDDFRDQVDQKLNNWNASDAAHSLRSAANYASLILTHNYDGEYGHIHHKFVAESLRELLAIKVHFSKFETCTISYQAPGLNLDDFPLHKAVLVQFPNLDIGCYIDGNQNN